MSKRQFLVCAGEPSGDIHGSNLIRAMKECDSACEFQGVGGPRMATAGCKIIHPLAEKPIMGLIAGALAAPRMVGLLRRIDRELKTLRPSAVILIDNPGFNFAVARLAKKRNIPVVYHVPPQIWAWATWRVKRIRRLVDVLLCSLPFEETWYHSRGVPFAHYVGHPFFDDLSSRKLDNHFIAKRTQRDCARVVLLAGSRQSEAQANSRLIVESAAKLRRLVPYARLDVAAFNRTTAAIVDKEARRMRLAMDIHVGRTRELIAGARAAIAVSGSVSLELLHYRIPTAIVFKISSFAERVLMPWALHVPHVSLVNLLAGRRVFPEYVGSRAFSGDIARTVAGWLADESSRLAVKTQLEGLLRHYGQPGASQKAAQLIFSHLESRHSPLRKSA